MNAPHTNDIDILKFCGTGSYREHYRAPMQHDGKIYATNGHIAICRDARDGELYADTPSSMASRITELFDGIYSITQWEEMPPLNKEGPKCVVCGGTGTVAYEEVQCPSCDSDGMVYFHHNFTDVSGIYHHTEYESECSYCDGDGAIKTASNGETHTCNHCDGAGVEPGEWEIICGVRIAYRYIELISKLPDLKICNIDNETLALRSGEYIGVVKGLVITAEQQ